MKNSTMKISLSLVLMLTGLLISSCSKNGLHLIENGTSEYEIVHAGEATRSQVKSAEVLQSYLHKISGSTLSIVDESSQNEGGHKIYIGNFKQESLDEHGLSISEQDGNLYISGGSDKAINNAVYVFLENYLGCDWYAPGVEKIPVKTSISLPLPLAYTYTPEITTRTVHSRLYYENDAYADAQKVTYESFPFYVPQARVHTFHRFVPEEKFYKAHPEYFAWRGENRLPTQLCLTNKEVLWHCQRFGSGPFFKDTPMLLWFR